MLDSRFISNTLKLWGEIIIQFDVIDFTCDDKNVKISCSSHKVQTPKILTFPVLNQYDRNKMSNFFGLFLNKNN